MTKTHRGKSEKKRKEGGDGRCVKPKYLWEIKIVCVEFVSKLQSLKKKKKILIRCTSIAVSVSTVYPAPRCSNINARTLTLLLDIKYLNQINK